MSSAIDGTRNSYAAALVSSILYGFYLLLAIQCIYGLLTKHGSTSGRNVALGYAVLLFIVQTVYYAAGCRWSAIEFVDASIDPAVFASELSGNLSLLKDTMYVINIWVADSFLLYRVYIIWSLHYVSLLPFALYLASLATGIGLLVETGKPGAVFGQASIINFGTPFWSLSVATNVCATVLIVSRLLYHHGALRRSTTRNPALSGTSPAVIMFVESAALYAVCGIIYIPLFAVDTPVQYPFSALLGGVVSIAPTLIMARVAKGTALTKEWSDIPLVDMPPVAQPAPSQSTETIPKYKIA
ncbi:hypothetical protein POSPLADRAFT_1056650 [Postia placenta MAD-698-R-SB12]|uniref:THH1/TOM1/TOM3 domain-containing protein n=1 Tax=Postia placenta MAD-698-R-SB12 TaxID=670580 RepID=A0A1X6N0B4_9APHY|nr:hypothetical protein POSPLADRAFT_1056650 [Postia placenta MAD-698-R-SB12]OSX62058.1 hypothetical protein POSPLADRAFT_1056650 [Postia placenta MAD-698-R-SB12]